MKKRPILFNGKMVRAILSGQKCVTRRLIKSLLGAGKIGHFGESDKRGYDYNFRNKRAWEYIKTNHALDRCPYGVTGDGLYARETFSTEWHDKTLYKADGGDMIINGHKSEPKWKPSIHMPKELSRIQLKIISVTIEPLAEMDDEDARNEGFRNLIDFWNAWNGMYAKEGFGIESRPWVWVINFDRMSEEIK